MDDTTRDILAACEKNGVEWARVWVVGQGSNDLGYAVRQWIAKQDADTASAREAEHKRITEASLRASLDAAEASKQSAKWTMVAAWVAAASALISLAGVIIQAVTGPH